MEFVNEGIIKLDKELNELDKFVLDFCRILEKHTKYMIVSGYVIILFGRSRGTEDVDVFIKEMKKQDFNKLFEELEDKGYECINTSKRDAFEELNEDIPLRFAKKNQFVPNIEIKLAKRPLDIHFLEKPLRVILSEGELRISFIEPQIAFKEVCLGSKKDIEDAYYLRKVFEGKINKEKIDYYKREFSK
ncbi:MAG: hypothetical protein KKG60_04105 [Nanoarchaeota archaeon]|nr:hypothetical protein [Nanoarchaeota archaeon]